MRYLAQIIDLLVATVQSRPTNRALLEASERILKLAPKLCRTLWDHRSFLRYNKEIRKHQRSGRDHDPGNSFAWMSGSCVLDLCLLHQLIRYGIFCLALV